MPQFDFHFTLLYFNIEEIGPWHHAQPEKKETNKQRKITIKPWLCIFRRNHFMHCSLSRYWSCSSWRAEVHCAWWSYSSFNFILTTRETCTWARMWISSGVSGNEISAAESQNFPLNDLICLPQKEKAFQACLLAASESSHAVNLMKYKSLQKKTWKVLLCFQLLRQNTSYIVTVPRKKKIEYNYLFFRSKNLPCLKFYFLFPGNGKDLKTSSIQKKTKETWQNMYFVSEMLWHRLYADEGTFSFCGAEIGSKSDFERRATTGSGSTFFSFLYTSKLTNLSLLSVFTLIMRHDLPENLGKTTAQE